MKVQLIIFSLYLLVTNCCTDNGFILQGELRNGNEQVLYLCQGKISSIDSNTIIVDSAKIENGSFVLKGHIEESDFYTLIFRNKNDMRKKFVLENTDYKISGDANEFYKIIIEGGLEQKHFIEWSSTSDSLKSAFMQNRQDNSLIEKIDSFDYQFIKEHPSSFISLFALSEFSIYEENREKSMELYRLLDSKLHNHSKSKTIYNNLFAAVVGNDAPVFNQPDVNGDTVSLNDLNEKIVLLEFWASWCAPCRRKHPIYKKFYDKYKNLGFEIVSVSLDQNKNAWMDAILQDSLTWINLSDLKGEENEVKKQYGIHYAGSNFLIDKNRKIIGRNVKPEELERLIKNRI